VFAQFDSSIVEVGQLAIVARIFLLAYGRRKSLIYLRLVLVSGFRGIAVLVCAWFTERAGDLKLFQL